MKKEKKKKRRAPNVSVSTRCFFLHRHHTFSTFGCARIFYYYYYRTFRKHWHLYAAPATPSHIKRIYNKKIKLAMNKRKETKTRKSDSRPLKCTKNRSQQRSYKTHRSENPAHIDALNAHGSSHWHQYKMQSVISKDITTNQKSLEAQQHSPSSMQALICGEAGRQATQ